MYFTEDNGMESVKFEEVPFHLLLYHVVSFVRVCKFPCKFRSLVIGPKL